MSVIPSSRREIAPAILSPRFLFAIVVAGSCLFYLMARLGPIDTGAVSAALADVSLARWAFAILLTALSFWAVGQYDALFHQWLRTGVPTKRASYCGASAIALSQTLGLGLLTGTLTRWRLLPELSLGDSLKLTNYVAFTFMIALGLVSAVALAFAPLAGTAGTITFASLAVAIAGAAVVLSVWRPSGLPVALPPLRLMGRITLLTALDVALAGAALWVLMPNVTGLDFSIFLAAFVLALGAGLLSGAPGGVGPFELCLIALLPAAPEPELVAGILAFRLVYYALPACLAFVALAKPISPKDVVFRLRTSLPVSRAEAPGLSRQAGVPLVPLGSVAQVCALETSQSLVAIGDPATGGTFAPWHFGALSYAGAGRGLGAAAYKISAKSALAARAAGWCVMVVSEDAWLKPNTFSTDGPAKRQLRRKLRQAEKASVSVVTPKTLPIKEMRQVSEDWAARSGGERGFSMGRFDPDYIAEQRVFLAFAADRLVAFATFHTAADEWVLDLMRSADDMPDGAMHALVQAALCAAKSEGVARLSLAAIPLETPAGLLKYMPEQGGLRRFKMSFAPKLSKLYMAAPGPVQLALAGLDIALRIQAPKPARPSFKFSALQKMQGGVSRLSVVPSPVLAQFRDITSSTKSKERPQ